MIPVFSSASPEFRPSLMTYVPFVAIIFESIRSLYEIKCVHIQERVKRIIRALAHSAAIPDDTSRSNPTSG